MSPKAAEAYKSVFANYGFDDAVVEAAVAVTIGSVTRPEIEQTLPQ